MHCNQSLVKGKLWNDLFKMKGQEASSWLKMRTHALPMWFSKYWDLVKKLGFRTFLWISGRPRARGIHIFCLKSQILREIPKKARNPNYRENHMGRPQKNKNCH